VLIGLTGQIGSGKTAAAKILASFGAIVLDADQIGRQVVDESPNLRAKLSRAFGEGIVGKDGRLIRKRLAELAFMDDRSKKRLNDLVHPFLLRRLRHLVRSLSKQRRPIVIDAALLLDWRMEREVDAVIVISASRRVRLSRLTRRGLSRRDALARERAQLPLSIYRAKADYILSNSGTKRELRAKLRDVWLMLTSETR
jgi:dephospho-CoA kinase